MGLPDFISPAVGAAAGSIATLITQALDRHYRKKEKRDEREVEDAKLLHQSEVEFRKALLERIRQLERHDADKSQRIASQAQRIAELESENGRLRAKISELEARS